MSFLQTAMGVAEPLILGGDVGDQLAGAPAHSGTALSDAKKGTESGGDPGGATDRMA
jgi:hypothetical protein